MIVDFRLKKSDMAPLVINGEEVERVEFFKFLGTIVSDNFKWDRNTTGIVKKNAIRDSSSYANFKNLVYVRLR